jgi:hypothetical protein
MLYDAQCTVLNTNQAIRLQRSDSTNNAQFPDAIRSIYRGVIQALGMCSDPCFVTYKRQVPNATSSYRTSPSFLPSFLFPVCTPKPPFLPQISQSLTHITLTPTCRTNQILSLPQITHTLMEVNPILWIIPFPPLLPSSQDT